MALSNFAFGQQLALAEECLLLLILLATEMPLAPDRPGYDQPSDKKNDACAVKTNTRVGRQLRRELVHRLASAPCTHSELQDSCNSAYTSETVDSDVRLLDIFVCLLGGFVICVFCVFCFVLSTGCRR